MSAIYDQIGTTYHVTRQADIRIVDRIIDLLDLPKGSRILDVGAGTGSYARALADRSYQVTALEPSAVMRNQAHPQSSITWVEGSAEVLPFENDSFDAAILILCIHHFSNLTNAFAELQRVVSSGPILIFTYDPAAVDAPWLFQYFPIFRSQIQNTFPSLETIRSHFGSSALFQAIPFPLPHDLTDNFAGAAWRYPERYLDPSFRDGTSAFRQLDPGLCEKGLDDLTSDLTSGAWDEKFGHVRSLDEYDHGYAFVLIQNESKLVR